MALTHKQIFQARVNATAATSVHSPAASSTSIIRTLIICNNTGSPVTWSLYHDTDGTTYSEATVLFNNQTLEAYQTVTIEFEGAGLAMNNSSGNLALAPGTANALTISGYGTVIT